VTVLCPICLPVLALHAVAYFISWYLLNDFLDSFFQMSHVSKFYPLNIILYRSHSKKSSYVKSVLLGGDGIEPSLTVFLPESDTLSMKILAARPCNCFWVGESKYTVIYLMALAYFEMQPLQTTPFFLWHSAFIRMLQSHFADPRTLFGQWFLI
jgi:hypothetical protein